MEYSDDYWSVFEYRRTIFFYFNRCYFRRGFAPVFCIKFPNLRIYLLFSPLSLFICCWFLVFVSIFYFNQKFVGFITFVNIHKTTLVSAAICSFADHNKVHIIHCTHTYACRISSCQNSIQQNYDISCFVHLGLECDSIYVWFGFKDVWKRNQKIYRSTKADFNPNENTVCMCMCELVSRFFYNFVRSVVQKNVVFWAKKCIIVLFLRRSFALCLFFRSSLAILSFILWLWQYACIVYHRCRLRQCFFPFFICLCIDEVKIYLVVFG